MPRSHSRSSRSGSKSSRSATPRVKREGRPPRPPGRSDNPTRIWIGGLPDRIKKEDLHQDMQKYGTVVHVNIRSSQRDVFAFVEFDTPEAAQKAIGSLDQQFIKGSRVKVHYADMKTAAKNSNNQIWIGQLQKDQDEEGLEDVFEKFGKVIELKIRAKEDNMFAFCKYETTKAAEDAIEAFKDGNTYRVAWASEDRSTRRSRRSRSNSRRRRSPSYGRRRRRSRSRSRRYNSRSRSRGRRGRSRSPRRRSRSRGRTRAVPKGAYKIEVKNIPTEMTWMDLKSLGRRYGGRDSVTFARTWDSDNKHMGIIEFSNKSAMNKAVDSLDNHRINGYKVYCKVISD